jgi:Ca2+-binding RTX toxin-like protein
MSSKINSVTKDVVTPGMVEQLEGRRMMSVSMQDGVVVVSGTDGADSVQIFATDAGSQPMLCVEIYSGDQGTVANFPLSEVTGVKVDGLGGNDHLFVDRTYGALSVPVTLFGGAGDDVLIGGAGIDELVGGTGADWIDAGEGAWLESSDAWFVRSENGATTPEMDGDRQAVGEDTVATATQSDLVDGAGADRLMPAGTGDGFVESNANGGLFADDAEAKIWEM